MSEKPSKKNVIEMWVVYDNPTDYPGKFLARKWMGATATNDRIESSELSVIHEFLGGLGFVRVAPDPKDNPAIKEIWL